MEYPKDGRHYSAILVEDDSRLRETTAALLSGFFSRVDTAANGEEGLARYTEKRHDFIITDINMPGMNGVELTSAARKINPNQDIIIISGHDESEYLIELINLGVSNFIMKPFEKGTLFRVVEDVVHAKKLYDLEKSYQRQIEEEVAVKTRELKDSLQVIKELSDELILRLTATAEYRDSYTGSHINRIGKYSELLCRMLKLDAPTTETISFAAPLHDIGKVGIPDNILMKSGPLNEHEYGIMKNHTKIGARILDNSRYERIRAACSGALTHHEKWDGTGYPSGAAGDEIPLVGRIIAVCDVYDAMRSQRPYKGTIGHKEACARIIEGDERTSPDQFDPQVLQAFRESCEEFGNIYALNQTGL